MSRYDIEKFDPPPDPDLVCCICQCVLDKAVECPCRHVFCQGCIERWLSSRHTCPTCRKRTRKPDLKPVLPLVQNMLNRLLMVCEYRDNGCVEKIMLEHFERHIKNCGYEMKTCRFSKCSVRILHMHLEAHEAEQCEHREMLCDGECALMIPLSDRPTHNCVTALKARIDEKIGVIEQLKVKSHELTNLSQSLNDQLVELRRQLTDRTYVFSSSDDSDITDFMSDDLSRDSWFDSAASNFSADNVDVVDNFSNSNNDTNQDNSNNGNNEGSDVVEQVERTVVNSLFELSSRLERVRNQMRAVLNSRLVQDQNSLNDEVRIPSAALDAIVNSSNNDDNNRIPASSSAIVAESYDNYDNYNNTNNRYRIEETCADNNASENDDGEYLTDDDNHSYADRSYDRYSNVTESQWGSFTDEGLPVNIPSDDLNWISDSDSNNTPHNHSPTPSPDDDNSDANHSFANEATEKRSNNNHCVSEHIILAQPPDSPSDSTGSFSSIRSTSTIANSPFREDDDDSHHVRPVFSSPETNITFSPPQKYFVSTVNNWRSPEQNSSPSQRSSYSYEFTEESGIHIDLLANSSPAHSVASLTSISERDSLAFEASLISSDTSNISFISSIENSGHDTVDLDDKSDGDANSHSLGSPLSCDTDITDSEPDDVRSIHETGNRSGHYETRHSDSSLDYELGESFDEADIVEHLSETSAEGMSHHEDNEESDDYEDNTCSSNSKPLASKTGLKYDDNEVSATKDEQVSRCEPDSTQSPSALQQQQSGLESEEGSSANVSALILTATDSTEDTDASESMKYLTKRLRHIEQSTVHSEHEDFVDMNSGNDDHERNAVIGDHQGTETHSSIDHLDMCGVPGSENPNITSGHREHKKFRKWKQDSDAFASGGCKRNRSSVVPPQSGNDQSHLTSQQFDPKDIVGVVSDKDYSNSTSTPRYEFRKRSHESDNRSCNDSKKIKPSGMISQHSNGQTYSQRSRKSPPRNRQARRQSHSSQQCWRIRPSANKRSNPPNVSNDMAGQSLNVKIDLSLINYSGCLSNDSSSTAIPTAAIVHSANLSPINTPASVRREAGHAGSRQHVPDNSTKSSSPKPEDAPYRHRQRSSRSQRRDSQCSTRSINANTSPARAMSNIYNIGNRYFPSSKSWRDSSDSSSDNTWEPSSDCDDVDDTVTEGEDGFETDSSYEVQIPKSTAALLEEFASDESDESWTVGMN